MVSANADESFFRMLAARVADSNAQGPRHDRIHHPKVAAVSIVSSDPFFFFFPSTNLEVLEMCVA